jgi:hypothetical protein
MEVKAPDSSSTTQQPEDEMQTPNHKTRSSEVQIAQDTDAEKVSPCRHEGVVGEEDYEYITGIKLGVVLVAATLVYFLLMLDGSIITTVGSDTLQLSKLDDKSSLNADHRPGHPTNHQRLPFPSRCRMVRKRLPTWQVSSMAVDLRFELL